MQGFEPATYRVKVVLYHRANRARGNRAGKCGMPFGRARVFWSSRSGLGVGTS